MFCLGQGQLMMRVAVRSSSVGAAPEAGLVNLVVVNPALLGIFYPRLPSRLFQENLLF